MNKIVSCPFCRSGKQALITKQPGMVPMFCVKCSRCQAEGPLCLQDFVAVLEWNARPPEPIDTKIAPFNKNKFLKDYP